MRRHWFTRWKGRMKRELAESAGDRKAEAEGLVEAVTGEEPDDQTLERATRQVRRKHGDIR